MRLQHARAIRRLTDFILLGAITVAVCATICAVFFLAYAAALALVAK